MKTETETEMAERPKSRARTKTSKKRARPPANRRRAAPANAIWVVASIYNENDGCYELVENAIWFNTEKKAKQAAEERVRHIYEEVLGNQPSGELPFDMVFEKVDNKDPEFMDWGWDPVDGSCCVRVRVFKAYSGAV